jgi:hypothetical protein
VQAGFALLLIAACAYLVGAGGIFTLCTENAARSTNKGLKSLQKTMKNRRGLLRVQRCGHEMDLLGLGDLTLRGR